jgi:hypothetical protein
LRRQSRHKGQEYACSGREMSASYHGPAPMVCDPVHRMVRHRNDRNGLGRRQIEG